MAQGQQDAKSGLIRECLGQIYKLTHIYFEYSRNNELTIANATQSVKLGTRNLE